MKTKFQRILKKSVYWVGVVVIGAILGVSLQFTSAAWINPPASPPNSNVGAPITTGSASQTKSGLLGVTSLEERWVSGTPYIDFSNDASSDFDGRIILNSDDELIVDGASIESKMTPEGNDPWWYGRTKLMKWGLLGAGDIFIEPASGSTLHLTDNWSSTGLLDVQFKNVNITNGTLALGANDTVNEGGELILKGAGSNASSYIDNLAGSLRFYNNVNGWTEKFTVSASGESIGYLAKINYNGQVTQYPQVQLGKKMYHVSGWFAGNVLNVPQADINEYCGDLDGCLVTIVMSNWDSTNSSASREERMFYNTANGRFRFANNDLEGLNNNGQTKDWDVWDCHFTDAETRTGVLNGRSDSNADFGFLNVAQINGAYDSEGNYYEYQVVRNTDCRLIISD